MGPQTVSSWEKSTTVATWLQLVIVGISLIFIWSQLQQQKTQLEQQTTQLEQQIKLSRAANTQTLVELITPLNLRLTDHEMADLWVRGYDGIQAIPNPRERKIKRQQYDSLIASQMVFYENVYSQFCDGLLEKEIYEGWDRDLADFIKDRALRVHWDGWKNLYRSGFREHVSEIIEFQRTSPDGLVPPNQTNICRGPAK